jgi:hypothetical protein
MVDPHACRIGRAAEDTRTRRQRAVCANSQATRLAVVSLPSTRSCPDPSARRDPVQTWCCPERLTFASKRVARSATPRV